MQRAHAELLQRLERLPPQALDDPTHQYTVRQWLPAPGWSHEREHMSEVRAWWRTRPKRRAPKAGSTRRRR